MKLSTIIILLFTLVAFATNSILCRLALISGSIGAVEFTIVRLTSGMLILLPIIIFHKKLFTQQSNKSDSGSSILKIKLSNLWQPLTLFGYAIFFSLAYVSLDTGIGALILFPTVQITMVGVSLYQGNKLSQNEWLGFAIALAGLFYLLSPGVTAPSLGGTLMMLASGISWGVYSLLGKKVLLPILATARNFLFTLPFVLILILIVLFQNSDIYSLHVTSKGFLLAICSGAFASGIGYVLWYLSLQKITTTAASISQLTVPVFAALGGIIFLHESISSRLVIASVLIIGGILLTIFKKRKSLT